MSEQPIPPLKQPIIIVEDQFKKQFTTVTLFSKILAAVLFITLPFIGFWLGLHFQSTRVETSINGETAQTLATSSDTSIATDRDEVDPVVTTFFEIRIYHNQTYGFAMKYPTALTEVIGGGVVNLALCKIAASICDEAFSVFVQKATSIDEWYASTMLGSYFDDVFVAPKYEDTTINSMPARRMLSPRNSLNSGGTPCSVTAIYHKGRVFELCDHLHNAMTSLIIDSFVIE